MFTFKKTFRGAFNYYIGITTNECNDQPVCFNLPVDFGKTLKMQGIFYKSSVDEQLQNRIYTIYETIYNNYMYIVCLTMTHRHGYFFSLILNISFIFVAFFPLFCISRSSYLNVFVYNILMVICKKNLKILLQKHTQTRSRGNRRRELFEKLITNLGYFLILVFFLQLINLISLRVLYSNIAAK